MKRVISSILLLLLLSGCADTITDTDVEDENLVIKITSPADNDSISYYGAKIEYELKVLAGINFIELYINNTFIENFPPVNNQKPQVNLSIDSALTGNKIELFLLYFDKNGSSYKSNTVKNILITKDRSLPASPYNIIIFKLDAGTVNISWQDKSSYVTAYEIWRREGLTGDFLKHKTVSADARNVNDENLTPGIIYYYKLRTVSENGYSDFSDVVNSSGSGGSADIPAPSGLTAVVKDDRVVFLSWTDNSDNENYFKIERRRDWTQYEPVGYATRNSTSYTDSASGLTGGSEYYYRVKAVSDKDSSWSNEVYILIPSYFLKKPAIISVINNASRKVTLKWRDNDQHYADFIIERKTAGGFYTEVAAVTGNLSIYEDNIQPLNHYTYRIKQNIGALNSEYSDEVIIETQVIPLPAPHNISGYFDGSYMIINWEYNHDADNFVIERRDSTNGTPFTELKVTDNNDRNYSDGNTTCQHIYVYRIKALDPYSTSPYSSERVLKNWQICP
jgi:hypothetical protein